VLAFLRTLLDVRRGERTRTALMFLYFFLVVASFWFLKPARSALTLKNLSADPIPVLRLVSVLVLSGVVAGWSVLVTRMSRDRLAFLVTGAFFWLMVFFAWAFHAAGSSPLLYGTFYVFLDLFVTVNTALFWTYLADISDGDSARRLYGIIGTGGVLGGFFGSFFSRQVEAATDPGAMMLMVLAAYALLFPILRAVGHRAGGDLRDPRPMVAPGAHRLAGAFEGAATVLRSRYFLAIFAILAAYEFVSAVNDFCFHKAVDLLVPRRELEDFFAGFFLWVNLLAAGVQLVVTPLLVRTLGPALALLLLPALLLGLSAGFLLVPALLSVQALVLTDNALNYSLNQTSRELLFLPATREERYRALAFIDMFGLRASKALAGGAMLVLQGLVVVHDTGDLRWYMIVTAGPVAGWIACTLWLARRHGRRR